MSQKIVIKANVKRDPQSNTAKVNYEWNWRRIVSISMLILMTSAAVAYGLTSTVDTEPGKHPNEQAHFLSFKNNTQNDSALLDNTDDKKRITEAKIDPMLVVQTQQNESQAQRNADELPVNQKKAVAELTLEPTENENASNVLFETETDDGALKGTKGFSLTAQVASVALGAQIDTSKISRAVLTRKVSKREPTNVFAADIRLSQFEEELSFFSELKNLQGQTVKHVWSFEGEKMAEITLNIASARYRTYSTKNIMNSQTGHWRVDVIDEQGSLIAQKEFRILAD